MIMIPAKYLNMWISPPRHPHYRRGGVDAFWLYRATPCTLLKECRVAQPGTAGWQEERMASGPAGEKATAHR